MKRVQVRPEPSLNIPVWHELKEVYREAEPTGILFEDPDFPAADASICGITSTPRTSSGRWCSRCFHRRGDHASPACARYLKDMMMHVVPGWVRPQQMVGQEAKQYRLHGFSGEPCLFSHVSPRDIKQGYIGDCWLVSSFSTLAEYPDRVRALFKQQTLAEDGRYDIRLYCPSEEEWKVVTIDDRLPYWQKAFSYGQPCFAQPTQENEFWPCLLEKAVAKLVGAYYRIAGGFEFMALEMLTGKPSLCIELNLTPDSHAPYVLLSGPDETQCKHAEVYQRTSSVDADWGYWSHDASVMCDNHAKLSDAYLWVATPLSGECLGVLASDVKTQYARDDKLKEWDSKGYSIACGSRGDYQGIIQAHAYCVLRIVDLVVLCEKKPETLRLLHLRNPHRKNEWQGKWSDNDPMWNRYPEALKACKHTVGCNDNGVFWMEWEDFKHGFRELTISFDQQEGARYTNESHAARKEHMAVKWGITGHQTWTGIAE